MDEREKRKKILFTVLGVIVLILLFFWIKSCSGGATPKKTTKDITSVDLKTESLTLVVGESDKLSYTIIPSNANETTKWISSDNSVVSVDARGNINALKAGNAIVSLVSESGVSDYTVVKVVSKETVDGNVVTIGLVENDTNIKVGTTKKMLFDIKPIDTPYNEVLWESSNNLVASVSSDGVVKGLRSGVTTLTLKVILNDNSTITDSATITVEENASLYLTSTIGDVKEGEVIRAVVALSDASISIVDGSVKSSSEKAATISNITTESNYLTFDIKGIKKGSTTLKVSATTSEGKDLSLDIPIAVIGYDDLYISSGDKEISVGEKFILSGRMEPTVSGNLDTICSSSSNKVATASFIDAIGEYNGSCQVTGLKKGTTNISITIAGKKKAIKLTVVEDETPENPSIDPSNPSTGTDAPSTEIITDTTLTSIEAVLSKSEYNRNEAMGTLTVTAIYGGGSKEELSSSDYVMINDFDSSTLGSKTLNIACTKGDVTKVTSVSYTVTGSSDTPQGSTIAGTTGYSGYSGGGGVPTSTGDTVKYTIGDPTISSDTTPLANGSYKGNVGIEASVVGDFSPQTHWLGIAVECKDGSSDCNPDSKDFVQATIFELHYNDEDGKITGELPSTIDGKSTIYVGGSWNSLESLKGNNLVNSNGVTNSLSNLKVITNNTYFNGQSISDADKISFTTEAGTGANNITVSDCGSITLTPDKSWYGIKDTATITVSANGKNGCYLKSLTVGEKTEKFMSGTISASRYQTILISNTKSVKADATFITSSGELFPVSNSIELKIDDTPPTCSITVDENKNFIKVFGNDSNSGIRNIVSTNGLKHGVNVKIDSNYLMYEFPINKAGVYNFTVQDLAGNSAKCDPVTIEQYDCYQKSVCGGDNGTNCLACEEAGCKYEERDSLHRLYVCSSFDEPDVMLWLDKKNLNGQWNLTIGNVYYEGTYYSCNLSNEVDNAWCAKKDTFILDKNIEKEKTDFNKNCKLCGCDKWSSFESDTWYRTYNTKIEALSGADFITAYRTAKSKDSECKQITNKEEWKCGIGAALGPNAPTQCHNG